MAPAAACLKSHEASAKAGMYRRWHKGPGHTAARPGADGSTAPQQYTHQTVRYNVQLPASASNTSPRAALHTDLQPSGPSAPQLSTTHTQHTIHATIHGKCYQCNLHPATFVGTFAHHKPALCRVSSNGARTPWLPPLYQYTLGWSSQNPLVFGGSAGRELEEGRDEHELKGAQGTHTW